MLNENVFQPRWRSLSLIALGLSGALFAATAVQAGGEVESYRYSLDIDAQLFGVSMSDESVVDQNLNGALSATNALGIPAQAALDAYTLVDSGAEVFSVDTAVEIGGVLAEPGDLVRLEAGVWSLELDASALGVPSAVNLDAVAWIDGQYLVSFDSTVELPSSMGGTLLVDDDDLVTTDGSSFGSLAFDGSVHGVPAAADIDAAYAHEDFFYLSFDISGEVDGVAFDDEDLLFVGTDGTGWGISVDLDAVYPGLYGGIDSEASHFVLGEEPMFADGFESGDATAWSNF